MLIEHSEERAQLNALNYHGESALTFATRYGHTDTVGRPALSSTPSPPHPLMHTLRLPLSLIHPPPSHPHSLSLLCTTTLHSHSQVKLLLDKGAELLVELCKPFWTSLHRAAANGHEATCTALIRHVARSHEPSQTLTLLNHTDAKGTTPLMAAANSNYSTTVRAACHGPPRVALWWPSSNGSECPPSTLRAPSEYPPTAPRHPPIATPSP